VTSDRQQDNLVKHIELHNQSHQLSQTIDTCIIMSHTSSKESREGNSQRFPTRQSEKHDAPTSSSSWRQRGPGGDQSTNNERYNGHRGGDTSNAGSSWRFSGRGGRGRDNQQQQTNFANRSGRNVNSNFNDSPPAPIKPSESSVSSEVKLQSADNERQAQDVSSEPPQLKVNSRAAALGVPSVS
jgi:hypothetical protein